MTVCRCSATISGSRDPPTPNARCWRLHSSVVSLPQRLRSAALLCSHPELIDQAMHCPRILLIGTGGTIAGTALRPLS